MASPSLHLPNQSRRSLGSAQAEPDKAGWWCAFAKIRTDFITNWRGG